MNILSWLQSKWGKKEEFAPPCSVCGSPAATLQIFHTGKGPQLAYSGIVAGTGGSADLVSLERVTAIRLAFSPPYVYAGIRAADFYDDAGFCAECGKFYCFTHWNIATTGSGRCPHGHFKSLDPHWSPVPGWQNDE